MILLSLYGLLATGRSLLAASFVTSLKLNLSTVLTIHNTRVNNCLISHAIILPVHLYGCETWWLTLTEERRLRVFENRVLRRIFGPKRERSQGNGEDYIMRSLMICTDHQILFE